MKPRGALVIYLAESGYRDPELPFDPGAPVEEVERHVAQVAVLRLDPLPSPRCPLNPGLLDAASAGRVRVAPVACWPGVSAPTTASLR